MSKKTHVEFMGMKLDLSKTRNKVQYERKYGSPMKEIFKLMKMYELIEAMQTGGDLSKVDFENLDLMSIDFMANLIHASAQRFNANINMDIIYDMIDIYLEDKTIFDLMSVAMEILEQAGYLNFGEEEQPQED